jgi:hypothetical protein
MVSQRYVVAALALTFAWCAAGAAPQPTPAPRPVPAPAMRVYETPYYFIHTDMDGPRAAEAVARMRRLAPEYRRRTREMGFTGVIRERLPFNLFSSREDYVAAGGAPKSAGAFLGDRLVAVAMLKNGSPLWNVVQHEAFHQFAAAVEGPELPGWVSEGLGEYFGEGLFTGDGFVTGVVPHWRAARVKESINVGRFKPLEALLKMSQEDWNEKIEIANYDQAWSVVQFILHGDGDDGTKRLAKFVKAITAGGDAGAAFTSAFGDSGQFERHWKAYWQGLPEEPTPEAYARAGVATVTSFVARAAAVGQSFKSFDEFEAATRNGALRSRPDDWLPIQLLQQNAWPNERARVELSIEGAGEGTRVVGATPDGTRLVGTFTLEDGRVKEVLVRKDVTLNPEP